MCLDPFPVACLTAAVSEKRRCRGVLSFSLSVYPSFSLSLSLSNLFVYLSLSPLVKADHKVGPT